MMIFLISAAALAAVFGLYLFMIWPRGRKDCAFLGRIYAHRGDFDNVHVPENSLAAFSRALSRGVGIELDLHLTADGEVIVFHDDTLTRMCKDGRAPEEMTAREIASMRLLGTKEHIPTLREVLALVSGKVPLIVELKGKTANAALADAAMPILEGYGGPYCVQSFNPLLVARYRRLAPSVMRGILTTKFKKDGEKRGTLAYALQWMLANFLARPDFVSVKHIYADSLPVRLCKRLGAAVFVWTVRTKAEYADVRGRFDAVIGENLGEISEE